MTTDFERRLSERSAARKAEVTGGVRSRRARIQALRTLGIQNEVRRQQERNLDILRTVPSAHSTIAMMPAKYRGTATVLDFIPVVGTLINWESMSPRQRGISIAADIVTIGLPFTPVGRVVGLAGRSYKSLAIGRSAASAERAVVNLIERSPVASEFAGQAKVLFKAQKAFGRDLGRLEAAEAGVAVTPKGGIGWKLALRMRSQAQSRVQGSESRLYNAAKQLGKDAAERLPGADAPGARAAIIKHFADDTLLATRRAATGTGRVSPAVARAEKALGKSRQALTRATASGPAIERGGAAAIRSRDQILKLAAAVKRDVTKVQQAFERTGPSLDLKIASAEQELLIGIREGRPASIMRTIVQNLSELKAQRGLISAGSVKATAQTQAMLKATIKQFPKNKKLWGQDQRQVEVVLRELERGGVGPSIETLGTTGARSIVESLPMLRAAVKRFPADQSKWTARMKAAAADLKALERAAVPTIQRELAVLAEPRAGSLGRAGKGGATPNGGGTAVKTPTATRPPPTATRTTNVASQNQIVVNGIKYTPWLNVAKTLKLRLDRGALTVPEYNQTFSATFENSVLQGGQVYVPVKQAAAIDSIPYTPKPAKVAPAPTKPKRPPLPFIPSPGHPAWKKKPKPKPKPKPDPRIEDPFYVPSTPPGEEPGDPRGKPGVRPEDPPIDEPIPDLPVHIPTPPPVKRRPAPVPVKKPVPVPVKTPIPDTPVHIPTPPPVKKPIKVPVKKPIKVPEEKPDDAPGDEPVQKPQPDLVQTRPRKPPPAPPTTETPPPGRPPGVPGRPPGPPEKRFRLPGGKTLPAGVFPRVVAWDQGLVRIEVNLSTGQKRFHRITGTSRRPRESFKVLATTRRRPEARSFDQGVVTIGVTGRGLSFRQARQGRRSTGMRGRGM